MGNKRTPEVRFSRFSGDWEQRKLGDFTESYSGGTPSVGNKLYYGGSIPFIRSAEINSKSTELFITEDGLNNSSAKMVEEGDILYALYGATSGEVGISKMHGAINQAILAIKPKFDDDSYFITQWLKKQKSTIINTYLQGGQGNLSGSIVKDLIIPLPTNKDEQVKIGEFFKQLDDTIALHQKELTTLKQTKQGFLQKMFPKEGESVPEVRFPGFTGDWEERKLNEVAEIIGGGTPRTNVPEYWDGDIDWYSPVEIGKKTYATGSQRKITSLGLKKSSAKVLPANKTILFTSRAGIGDMAILKKDGATNQGFQSLVINNDYDIYFVYSIGYKIKEFALKHASGSTFLEISGKRLRGMDLLVPSLKEQFKIGNFFKKLDDTIALHQRELDTLKETKKAFLQKMFV
ncbi:restriction endonuclease subunit S [Bacillus nakamurai]|uniref:restriction endonuclease subunit S n=1 Tax=Bacillus nakamurai TaxID=1793963 RepID=UPI0007787062|nr:restriction endonuclease subunit S [Bacillus nakamurai]KXZ17880.1 restriction endonuclease subunit S [Bacillus nakamurai]